MGKIKKGLTWAEAREYLDDGYYTRPAGTEDWLTRTPGPTLVPAGATKRYEPPNVSWEVIHGADAFPIPKAAFFSEVEVADLRRENAEMKAKLYKLGDDILSYGGSDE